MSSTPSASTSRWTSVDPEEMRYAPRPPRRFTWARRIAVLAVIAILVAIVAIAGYKWSQSQYYVADDGDEVAIFRGVEANVPGIQHAPRRGGQRPDAGRPADLQRPPGPGRDQRQQPRRRPRHRQPAAAPRPVPRAHRRRAQLPSPSSKPSPSRRPGKNKKNRQVQRAQAPTTVPDQVSVRAPIRAPAVCTETP